MAMAFFDFIAREHPAFIHVPLGLVVTVPVALVVSFRAVVPRIWIRNAFYLAGMALAGSVAALYTGLLWGRQVNLIPTGRFLPQVASSGQVLQKVLWRHELLAVTGVAAGLLCFWLLWRGLRRPGLRGAALAASLLWVGCWGATGMLGGTMVFGNAETNKAAAAADAAHKADAEADLPIRALDYASLEPVGTRPFRSKAHGGHWGQIWVTASGVDAYQAGKPLPPGAYAVMSTVLDAHGKPGFQPGPLLMRETTAGGGQAFSFYWPRVPEALRPGTGGEDSVYWRAGPQVAACARCHATAGPAGQP